MERSDRLTDSHRQRSLVRTSNACSSALPARCWACTSWAALSAHLLLSRLQQRIALRQLDLGQSPSQFERPIGDRRTDARWESIETVCLAMAIGHSRILSVARRYKQAERTRWYFSREEEAAESSDTVYQPIELTWLT